MDTLFCGILWMVEAGVGEIELFPFHCGWNQALNLTLSETESVLAFCHSLIRVQDRSGAFVTRKGNVTVLMELPLSALPVLEISEDLQIFVRQLLNSAGRMKINGIESALSVGQNKNWAFINWTVNGSVEVVEEGECENEWLMVPGTAAGPSSALNLQWPWLRAEGIDGVLWSLWTAPHMHNSGAINPWISVWPVLE